MSPEHQDQDKSCHKTCHSIALILHRSCINNPTIVALKVHQKDRFFVGVNAVRISDTLLNDHA